MINLLPTDVKQEIMYGRRNTALRRWIIACVAALLGLALIIAGGLIYIQYSINSYSKQVEQSKEAMKTQKVVETQARVDEKSNNTKLAIQVLSREVLFSKLIPQIGSALPDDSILKGLDIDEVKGGIELSAAASNYNTATQVQVNLQDPKNNVFEKADINGITCSGQRFTRTEPRTYPCEINLRALFGDNKSYFYIQNQPAAGVKP